MSQAIGIAFDNVQLVITSVTGPGIPRPRFDEVLATLRPPTATAAAAIDFSARAGAVEAIEALSQKLERLAAELRAARSPGSRKVITCRLELTAPPQTSSPA